MGNSTIRQQVDTVFSILEEIEKVSSIKKKMSLLEKIKNIYVFKKITNIVYSNDFKTYISHKRLIDFDCGDKYKCSFEDFMDLTNKLNSRSIVGNKAEEEIRKFLLNCDKFHCKWYKRILAKDLRINVGPAIIEKLYEDDSGIIEKFNKPMMAINIRKIKEPEEFFKNEEWIYEEKIDGLRCLMFIKDNNFMCYSRNGKRLYGAEKYIQKGITDKTLSELDGFVLDGEFYSKNWSNTMTSVFDQNADIESFIKDTTYNLFDIIPIDKYISKKYRVNIIQRKKMLENIFNKKLLKKPFRLVPYFKLSNIKDIKIIYNLSDKFIKLGSEGIILKRSQSFYECKRSNDWVKVKDINTIDLRCVGIEKSYKRPGEISALIVEYKGKRCKVSSGLTDHDRQHFFKHPEDIIGYIVELQYQEESVDGCLRFPVFIRVRLDKDNPDK